MFPDPALSDKILAGLLLKIADTDIPAMEDLDNATQADQVPLLVQVRTRQAKPHLDAGEVAVAIPQKDGKYFAVYSFKSCGFVGLPPAKVAVLA